MKFFSLLFLMLIYKFEQYCHCINLTKEKSTSSVVEAETIENINNSHFHKYLSQNPQCTSINICNTCQNTLYFLKIHGKIDCRFTQCTEKCLSLNKDFFQNLSLYLQNKQIIVKYYI